MRLNKYLADCGVDSRRNCDKIILEKRVKVNNKLVTEMGYIVDDENDSVSLDGHKVVIKNKKVYIMLHKPKGYVTTVKDELDRKTVMEFVSDIRARIYPVGRLDYDTEGLLLMTNDGDLALKLTHPSNEVQKTYIARIDGEITLAELRRLSDGVEVEGKMTATAKAKLIGLEDNCSRVELTIHEGRNRQVKKMFEAIGKTVLFLKRSAIGDLKLGGLTRGTYRYLTEKEINYLKSMK